MENVIFKDVPTPLAEEKPSPAPSETNGSDIVVDWTEDEERKVVRKLDLTVMPLLVLAFSALQFDRGNIGNALTDNFLKNVGIVQNQYNVGQQLLSVGIVLLEIPSNLILYRIGPSLWISGQILAWGLVATFQAFQKGLGAFLVTRLLLGLCESGFIPAGLFSITTFYTKKEVAKRFSVFFLGNMTAQAASGLIAYGVLHMRGVGGLAGWQWLFILEGLYTIIVAFIFAALYPGSPKNPVSLIRLSYFSPRERHIIQTRIIAADGQSATTRKTISRQELTSTLKNWRIYPHLLLTIGALAPSSTMWSYAPTMLTSFGYPRLQSNALVSVGCWLLLITTVISGYLSDRLNRRGFVVLGGLAMWWGFALGSRILAGSNSKSARYGILTLAIAFSSCWHPSNGAWLAVNAKTPGERSIRMAMFIMSANTSGIVGSQLFQAKDSPRYYTGWSIIVALISFAIACNVFCLVQYWLSNKRLEARGQVIDEKSDLKRYRY